MPTSDAEQYQVVPAVPHDFTVEDDTAEDDTAEDDTAEDDTAEDDTAEGNTGAPETTPETTALWRYQIVANRI